MQNFVSFLVCSGVRNRVQRSIGKIALTTKKHLNWILCLGVDSCKLVDILGLCPKTIEIMYIFFHRYSVP